MRRTPTASGRRPGGPDPVRRRLRRRRRAVSSARHARPRRPPRPPTRGAIAKNDANAAIPLKIGSKNFTEQKVLGEIYAQGLAAAGYNTSTDLNLGDQDTALAALKGGQIDAYPEYTGTALTAFFKKDAADLPKDAEAAYEELKACSSQDGITAFPPTPFTELQRGRGDRGDGRRSTA